jgi:hypothetical protein
MLDHLKLAAWQLWCSVRYHHEPVVAILLHGGKAKVCRCGKVVDTERQLKPNREQRRRAAKRVRSAR